MFDPETYRARRGRLRQALGEGLVLLVGHDESPMNFTANPYPFRQDGTFLYLVGLDSPGWAVLGDLDAGTWTLYGDDVTLDEIVWTGPRPKVADLAAAAGLEDSAPGARLAGTLGRALSAGRPLHYLPPYRASTRLALADLLERPPSQIDAGSSPDLVRAVVELRTVKSAQEIGEIERALEVSHEMHRIAMAESRPGVVEQAVVGAIEGAALARGSAPAFPTIFSVRGEVLHNHEHGNLMRAGDLALHDSGALSPHGYASDVTRTLPVSGHFEPRQKATYEVVLDALERSLEAVRPGVPFADVHTIACRRLASGLADLGLMRGDLDEAVAVGAHALFFQCGLGHMLGLDVHDMEALGEDRVGYDAEIRRNDQFGRRSLRLGRRLEPGFVITVEPGLYFIPALIDLWRAERRFTDFIDYEAAETWKDFGGIRIEEDVLVDADGHRVLGPPIPRRVEEVEAWAADA